MVFCTSTSQYCLRAVGRTDIRIQLSALRATADTEGSANSHHCMGTSIRKPEGNYPAMDIELC